MFSALLVPHDSGRLGRLDAGLMFPESGLPGVDFVVPDTNFLAEHSDQMRAVVLTHGHEDHIGALPFVLKAVNVPVYGTRFTLGLVESLLSPSGARLALVLPLSVVFFAARLLLFFVAPGLAIAARS